MPVVGTSALKKKSLGVLMSVVDDVVSKSNSNNPYKVEYADALENAINLLEPVIQNKCEDSLNSRWLALKLLDQDESLIQEINSYLGDEFLNDKSLQDSLTKAKELLNNGGISDENKLKDVVVSSLVKSAEEICKDAVTYHNKKYAAMDRKIDKILTSKLTGYPVMLVLLIMVFWLTITGANYPSQLLADGLFWVQDRLTDFFVYINAPDWLHGILILGVYRVLAWVISVMLPPMAIFFPLFTLLEDAGYLPRVAYNLDKPFKKCCACGKQSLCMCMGFGCNAAGVIGCRIIDSPRERLLAILTNNFVPCNGRFPTLIAILTMFFVGAAGGAYSSVLSAILLTAVIVLGVVITFAVTKILSKTLLKGLPSSFTLELPPYRKPQIGNVIVRSIFDRTLFVLGRAIVVAAPAGLVIWLMANIFVGDATILSHCVEFLDPFAKLMGLDGVILIAFILGFPANEIVVPIIIMAYMSQGSILELDSITEMKELFVSNGWTWVTAISTILFSLNHWPCSTTLLTIKKETGSWKWTAIAAAIPTVVGIAVCMIFNLIASFVV